MDDDLMSDEQENQLPQSDEPQTPGQILRAAREFRGYQPAVIAERLCRSMQTIIDIENDDYKHFKAEIYIRGLIRSYAKIVDVDPEMVLQAYAAMGVNIESDPQVPILLAEDIPISHRHRTRRRKRKSLMWASFGVLLVLIIMVVLWWKEQQSRLYYSQKTAVPIEKKTMHVLQTSADIVETSKIKTDKPKSTSQNVKKQHTKKQHRKRVRLTAHKSHTKPFVPDYSISPAKD